MRPGTKTRLPGHLEGRLHGRERDLAGVPPGGYDLSSAIVSAEAAAPVLRVADGGADVDEQEGRVLCQPGNRGQHVQRLPNHHRRAEPLLLDV